VSILVEGWAGGAGGSGVAATTSGQVSLGAGGGSGGYFRKWYAVAPAQGTYAIGAAGAAGANTGANNSNMNGGNTTFTDGTTLCTAFGGTGAPAALATGTAAGFILGGTGGAISTNGDVNIAGLPGGPAHRCVNTGLANQGLSGEGGGPGGGIGRITSGAGVAGSCPGAGGGGALGLSGAAAAIGGAGVAGKIVVWEYS
jgi:hypothetical protein